MNEKPYYNKAIDDDLRRIIPRQKFGDFTVILQDIFHRRAYEFGFSEQEILEQARNFASRVHAIRFVPASEMSSETAMGVYYPNQEIRLNQDYYLRQESRVGSELEFGEALYETLTHEVYHAINDYSELGYLGVSYSARDGWRGTALNEIITETAADRATISRTAEDAEKWRRDTDGYSDITFATNLLAASLGVTEKQLLHDGLQDRRALNNLIMSQFPTRKHGEIAQKKYFEAFETALDSVYNIEYKSERATNQTEWEMKRSMLKGALAGLYDSVYELAGYQMAVDERPITQEVSGEAEHRFAKMERIIADSMQYFSKTHDFTQQDVKEIYESIKDSRNRVANQVIGIDLLRKQGAKITNPRDYAKLVNMARNGTIFNGNNPKRINERYGITFPRYIGHMEASSITMDMEYSSHILREDFDDGMQWDNESAAIVITKIFREDMERRGVRPKDYYKFASMDTEEIPVIDDFDKTEEIPVVDDPDKTEEIPVVDDPDKTEEIPIIDDLDKTEPIPVVEENKGFFAKMADQIKGFLTRFKNRGQQQLAAGKTTAPVDKSDYYADLVTPSFDERYKVVIEKPYIPTENLNNNQHSRTKEEKSEEKGNDR